jgi:predicted RNase H-like nuclease (RuvC/YqgF family)
LLPSYPFPIIVGVDPGTTTAIAVLDTDGNLLSLMSKRNMSKSDVSRKILKYGKPVMVGADRRPSPEAVEKLAAVFSARLVAPEENLSRKDKNRLAKEFLKNSDFETSNRHERDALASAVYAYNTVKPTMLRIDHRLKALGFAGNKRLERFVKANVILRGDHVKRSIEKFFKSKGE